MRLDDVRARPQPQVERVAEDDLRADLVQFGGRHRLDGAVRAYWHEYRRFDAAVGKCQARASRCAGARDDFELHGAKASGGTLERDDAAVGLGDQPEGGTESALQESAVENDREREACAPDVELRAVGPAPRDLRQIARDDAGYAACGGEGERIAPDAVEVAAEVRAVRAEVRDDAVLRRYADMDYARGAGDPVVDRGIRFAACVALRPRRDDDGAGLGLVASCVSTRIAA